jgi:hypothetical protein
MWMKTVQSTAFGGISLILGTAMSGSYVLGVMIGLALGVTFAMLFNEGSRKSILTWFEF